jgi:hypothetical protein
MATGPQRLRRAAHLLDMNQFELIRLAEDFNPALTGYPGTSQRKELLRVARDYAAAVRRLARVRP